MTITLTREEAQQVLAVLDDLSPQHGRPDDVEEAIETLRARLSAPEPEPELKLISTGVTHIYSTGASVAQPEQRTGDCLLTGVCAAEGHRIHKTQPECVCGEPDTAGVHRQDGPCYQQHEPNYRDVVIKGDLSDVTLVRSNYEPKLVPCPVAWIYDFPNPDNPREDIVRDWTASSLEEVERCHGFNVRPLYTTPPQREWQGLTDEEMDAAMNYWSAPERSAYGGAHSADGEYVGMIDTWRYIEVKLREKNT